MPLLVSTLNLTLERGKRQGNMVGRSRRLGRKLKPNKLTSDPSSFDNAL